ncbi:MAG: mechanosensitive ion channel [Polyangiales bacterium]
MLSALATPWRASRGPRHRRPRARPRRAEDGEHFSAPSPSAPDQPFRVGDFIKVEDHAGTVESVGLRSTRMRTLDRTVVTIPNGKLADLRVENYSARDRFHLHCTLGLALSTPSERTRAVMQALRDTLTAHPLIWPDDTWVALKEISSDAVVVELRAWFQVTTFNDFHPIRTEMLMRFLEVIEEAGVELAYPTHTVHLVPGADGPAVTPAGHNPPDPSRLGH